MLTCTLPIGHFSLSNINSQFRLAEEEEVLLSCQYCKQRFAIEAMPDHVAICTSKRAPLARVIDLTSSTSGTSFYYKRSLLNKGNLDMRAVESQNADVNTRTDRIFTSDKSYSSVCLMMIYI